MARRSARHADRGCDRDRLDRAHSPRLSVATGPMNSRLARRRQTAVMHKPALAFLIEWGADQKGRRPLVLRVSSALARICAERGVPVLLCPYTGTRLFPVDLATEFMREVGASWSTTTTTPHRPTDPERRWTVAGAAARWEISDPGEATWPRSATGSLRASSCCRPTSSSILAQRVARCSSSFSPSLEETAGRLTELVD